MIPHSLLDPFPIHEEDKPVMDKYMAKLVSLGILSKNNTTPYIPSNVSSQKRYEK